MDLHELRVAARLIDGLAKRALFAEKQMVALEGQCAEWQRIADDLKAERNAAKQEAVSARQDAVTRAEADRKRIDGLMIQAQDMRAEIERLKKPRQHPVKVGESVRRTTEGSIAPIGTLGRVLVVWSDAYQVELRKGFSTMWAFDDCTPCDPPGSTHAEPDLTQLHAKGKEAWSDVPNATQWVEDMRGNTEASHDTPAGKEAAEAVVRDSQMTDTHDCGPNCPHCSW